MSLLGLRDISNLETPPADPGTTHVYVVDRAEQRVTRITVRPDGQDPNQDSLRPAISGDGAYVVDTLTASKRSGITRQK